MRYFIIAGEPSGDLHASHLMAEIRRLDENAIFMGMGGDRMQTNGLQTISHIKDFSVMGIIEVLMKVFTITKLFRTIKIAIQDFKPDRIILVDYGGFNLRIARFSKKQKIPVHFYILPKVWAWNEGRIKKIKKYVDKGYVIFPFEEAYFQKGGVDAVYVGNPVVEQIGQYLLNSHKEEQNPFQIALLPGSRDQELKLILPTMLSIAENFSNYQFVIAAPTKNELIPEVLPKNVRVEYNNTYSVVHTSKLAVVASGTATLETALLNTPQIVVYRASPISYAIGSRLVKIKFISPVNLILDQSLCTELIQNEFNKVNLEREVERCLDEAIQTKILKGYESLKSLLGNKNAAHEVAKNIVQ